MRYGSQGAWEELVHLNVNLKPFLESSLEASIFAEKNYSSVQKKKIIIIIKELAEQNMAQPSLPQLLKSYMPQQNPAQLGPLRVGTDPFGGGGVGRC